MAFHLVGLGDRAQSYPNHSNRHTVAIISPPFNLDDPETKITILLYKAIRIYRSL